MTTGLLDAEWGYRLAFPAMGAQHDAIERAAYCLRQAEQCLQLADSETEEKLRVEYRKMAQQYFNLAEAERQFADRLDLDKAAE